MKKFMRISSKKFMFAKVIGDFERAAYSISMPILDQFKQSWPEKHVIPHNSNGFHRDASSMALLANQLTTDSQSMTIC